MGLRKKLFYVKPEVSHLEAEKKRTPSAVSSLVKGLFKKKSHEEKLKITEETKEKAYLTQKAKISEVLIKIKWMESKQEGKLKRISELESRPFSLSVEDKILLKGLKNSSKRLEAKIVAAHSEISRRRSTIDLLGVADKKILSGSSKIPQAEPVYSEQDIRKEEKLAPKKLKVNELTEQILYMEQKQVGKIKRIVALREKEGSLSLDERFQLSTFKRNSKKLGRQINAVARHIWWQEDIIERDENLGETV